MDLDHVHDSGWAIPVLLHAITKKTPKIPPAELETAKRRMADYLERMG